MAHETLWKIVTDVLDRRDDGEAEVAAAAAAPPHGLLPWALWLLIALARHLRRQERVGEIVRAELGVDLAEIARSGRVELPERVPWTGRIPHRGTYRFHERGLRFEDDGGPDACVDVDLVAGGVDHVALWLFAENLRQNPAPRESDARLFELHPSYETFEFAWDELVELGLLDRAPAIGPLARLSAEAELHRDVLMRVGYELGSRGGDSGRSRLIMTARLGDWIEADRIAHHDGSLRWAGVFTEPRAAEQQARRRERLLGRKVSDRDGAMITALIELDAMAAAPHVREALTGPLNRRCAAAMREIRNRADMTWSPNPDYSADVIALFRRIDRQGRGFEHLIWPLCAEFLLDRSLHVDEVLATFSSVGEPLAPQASILAFMHAPDLAIPLLGRALHAQLPNVRADAVAILVLLREPWCAPTLAEALETSVDPIRTLEWRTGLRMLEDPGDALRAWEAAHPLTEEDRACLVRAETWIQERMRDLGGDVRQVQVLRAKARAPA